MDLGLEGRVYVVTGGSAGIGLAGATTLVDNGAKVVLVARDEERLRGAAAALGDSALGISGDLSEASTATRAVASAQARFGRLDGALISVGGPASGTPTSLSDDQWRLAFEQVFLAQMRVARAVAQSVGTTEGTLGYGPALLFILSSTYKQPLPGLATSNFLRPGLAMMVKDLADELGPRGVRVVGIAPGKIATDRVFMLDARQGSPEQVRRRNEAAIPLQRYGEPNEIGRVAAFLLSPAASYITGSVVAVDGGALRSV
jgi:3-oxoacyl-[acyl-carrier protein] reductase